LRSAVVLLAVALISACAEKPVPNGYKDAAALQDEYRAEVARLAVPPGVSLPPSAPEGGAAAFQEGVGRGDADFAWMCAWIRYWLKTRTNHVDEARRALQVLDTASTLPVWSDWDDAGRNALLRAVSEARSGHPENMTVISHALGCA
jgi:hypothetical protein